MSRPRNYSQVTIKKLFGLSGNQCAFPGCTKTLVNDKNALDSCICHIEAAKIGGERYNPNMTDKERADYNNLIPLCPQHHAETNDTNHYTVAVLHKMKIDHESQCMRERLQKNPSMLKNVVYAISEIYLEEKIETLVLNIFDPNDKIIFNKLKDSVAIIKEYRVYQSKLNTLYNELESQGSIRKEKLLKNIKATYITIKGHYIQDSEVPLSIIQENSDKIFNDIYDELYKRLKESGLFEEDIFTGLRIIMVDAFIRCKILEEPSRLNSDAKIEYVPAGYKNDNQ